MLLTLYYMAATWIQSWRLRSICGKIGQQIKDKTSVVFYNFPYNVNDLPSPSSELCTNHTQARVSNVLWLNGAQRGCSLIPAQNIQMRSWVSFPTSTNLLPFNFSTKNHELNDETRINLLVETECSPIDVKNSEHLSIEDFGELLAWKVDTHFAILLKSDLLHFTELILSSFMRDSFAINDGLPLIRVESVSLEGTPQPFDLLKNHSFLNRNLKSLSKDKWDKHLNSLRSMSILATQAIEFEYKKNRTEGKTGIVKPDLIISNNIDSIDSLPKISPKKSPINSPKIEKKPEIIPEPSSSKIEKPKTITTISVTKNRAPRPSLKRSSKGSLISCKPPNVLVYSDSISTRDSVISTLKRLLENDNYTIYPLSPSEVKTKIWLENTTMLVVCGSVSQEIGQILLDFFLKGGKMLCLCSDLLRIILPTYRTAEVREHELVQFSYGKWQKIKMMHHIFCYQPSPVKKHFSTEGEEPIPQKPVLVCPRSVDLKDLQGVEHSIHVQVLGTEETWNTPSLMLASNLNSGGKAVFSQVHLEADPAQFESDEQKFIVLKQSDKARLEILSDILKSYLGLIVDKTDKKFNQVLYSNAFFLGRHEVKFEMIEKLKSKMESENVLKNGELSLKFCGKGDSLPKPSETMLPILVNSCPENFSTIEYFDNLKTDKIGRLVIYSPILTSSMNVLTNLNFSHGIAVISNQQTKGVGRNKNEWLSPEGCLMFSLQLHIPLSSPLGQRVPLIQHLIVVGIVNGILNIEGYENLDIRLKWPNDIYANGTTKIGGLIINSMVDTSLAVCNIGCGLNLSNSNPTLCINDLIKEYNSRNSKKLKSLTYEKVLAIIFNEIELIWNRVQSGDLEYLYDLYYNLWLHSDAEVMIMDANGNKKPAKIIGIDEYGYLKVKQPGMKFESVHPDGNSFDMLQGLIVPKIN